MATLPKDSDLGNAALERSRENENENENKTGDLKSRKTMILSGDDGTPRPGSDRDRDPKAAGSGDRTGTTTADANRSTPATKPNRPGRPTFSKTTVAPPAKRRRWRRKELSSRNCFFVDRNHQMLVLYGPSYKEFVSQAPARKSSPTKPRNKAKPA